MNQQEVFQQRLDRIKKREQQGLALGDIEAGESRRSTGARFGGMLTPPLLLILSAGLGIVAVLALRLGFFHFAAASPADQTSAKDIALTAGLGFAAAFVLAEILGLSTRLQSLSLIAGVAIAVTGFHNLFHWAPAQMSAAFSPEYANRLTTMAAPNTVLVAGEVYAILPFDSGLIAAISEWTAGPTAMAEAEPEPSARPKRLQLDSQK